jgi:hypothetical protein
VKASVVYVEEGHGGSFASYPGVFIGSF